MSEVHIIRECTISIRDTEVARELARQVNPTTPLAGATAHPIIDALKDLGLTAQHSAGGRLEVSSGTDPEVTEGCYKALGVLMAALASFVVPTYPQLPAQIQWRDGDDEHRLWRWAFREGTLYGEAGEVTYITS